MIFKKGNMWKSTTSSKKFKTKEEAEAFEGIEVQTYETFEEALEEHGTTPEEEEESFANPLDLLRKASYGVKS